MRLYFARHGESQANLLHEFSNRGWKHGLTERGRSQAAVLAQRLSAFPITELYSSPLRRAVETTEILADVLGLPYTVTDALREYDCGILEGRSDPEGWALYHAVLEGWIFHHQWASRIPAGESFHDIRDRFLPFVYRLLEDAECSGSHVVLISHGGIYRCLLPLLLRNVDYDFVMNHPIARGGIVVAESTPEGLVCEAWSEGPPLPLVPDCLS